MATNNSWNNTIQNAKGGITLNAGTSAINIGSDATNNTINVGTGAGVKAVTIGSTNSSSGTTIYSGSGNLLANSNGATATFTSGSSGQVNIGSTGGTSRTSISAGSGGLDATATDITFNSGGTIDLGKLTLGDETINVGSNTLTSNSSFINIGNNIGASSVAVQCGSGGINIGTNSTNNTINIGTGAAVKSCVFGSTNTTSSTTIQSGSGALNVTSTNGAMTIGSGNGAMTINSGTGTLGISNDSSATTINIATGAAAKTVTLGTTNTTSSLALRYGTSDFTLASATGTVMSALDTGEITYPLQPAFQAYLGTTDSNVTGDGTTFRIGSGNALTEVFDNNSDFNTNGTFTAPVTGKYFFYVFAITQNTISSMTTYQLVIQTTAAGFNQAYQNGFANNAAGAFLGGNGSVICQMTAGDTCIFNIVVSGGTKTVEVYSGGANGLTSVGGYLVC